MTRDELSDRLRAAAGHYFAEWRIGVRATNAPVPPDVAAVAVYWPRDFGLFGDQSVVASVGMTLAAADAAEAGGPGGLDELLRDYCAAAHYSILDQLEKFYLNVTQAFRHRPEPLPPTD